MSERNDLRKTFFVTQKSIDYNKFRKKIDDYYMKNGNCPYIFMNDETIDTMIENIGLSSNGLHGVNTKGLCGRFQGNKVFCDNTLQFGEVELR